MDKNIYKRLSWVGMLSFLLFSFTSNGQLRIEGVIDGPLTDGTPKAIEVYAYSNIADLSAYGLGSASNGGGTDGVEFTFPKVAVSAGTSIWVATETTNFNAFFGFNPNYTNGSAPNFNGDDAIELFLNGVVVDVFGDISYPSGTGGSQPWNYLDGWAKRIAGGPDGATFIIENWSFSGPNALDGETSNATASDPYPFVTPCAGDAGDGQVIFINQVAQLNASSEKPGQWSGGLGSFSNISDPNATYTPDISEVNTSIQLTWATNNRNVYNVNRIINDGSVTGTITTDGTIGVITGGNIVDWNLTISDGLSTVQIFGPESGNNSLFGIIGNGFTATLTELIFDFSSLGSSYNFQGQGALWCITGPSFMCDLSLLPNAESIQIGNVESLDQVQRTGPHVMANGLNTECDQAFFSTQIVVFDNPDAEFFYDPAMMCPRDASELPQHTTGVDGVYTYSGVGLEINSNTGMIEVDDSERGMYTITNTVSACGNLMISGIIDGPILGGVPKAVELYAIGDIGNLGQYSIVAFYNGNTIGIEMQLPNVALAAGERYYISSFDLSGAAAFTDYFGFAPDYVDNVVRVNGDDAVALACNGVVYDVYGEIGVDGTGQVWEYLDGWAYRNSGDQPNGGKFNPDAWTFSGVRAIVGQTTNNNMVSSMPVGTFTTMANSVADDVQTFDINIEYDDAPYGSMSCLGEINVTIDPETCGAEINYLMMLFGVDPEGCFDYDVAIEGVEGNTITEPGVYRVSVTSGYDGNSCWGTVVVEDKAAPVITCPRDVIISCADDSDPASIYANVIALDDFAFAIVPAANFDGALNAALWGVTVDECTPYTLEYNDFFAKGNCVADTIYRTFTARDQNGMTASCTQMILLEIEDINDMTLPDDFDCTAEECSDRIHSYGTVSRSSVLACDEAGTVWNIMENELPSPYDKFDAAGNLVAFGTGKPSNVGICGTIHSAYSDIVIDICNDGCVSKAKSFKVVRQWTAIDWCTGQIVKHNQIIKVLDTEAPEFEELPDVTISTNLWNCGADYVLPRGDATDNCSEDIHVSWSASSGTIVDGILYVNSKTMPGSPITVYVHYSDCCGNVSTDEFLLNVADRVPPVVVADAHTVVSLSVNAEEGLTKIFAETFDDGSFDNCGAVQLSVRRMSGACAGFTQEDDNGKWFDFIHFCCKDVGKESQVIFRVCDDANMNGIFGEDKIGDNCNTAMIIVEVQDKLAPACAELDDMKISCIDAAALGDLVNAGPLNSINKKKVDALFGEANGAATCSVDIQQELKSSDDCGLGLIERIITVTNKNNGKTSTCTQEIHIYSDENVNFLTCDDITFPVGSAEYEAFKDYIEDTYEETSPYYLAEVWCLMNPRTIFVDPNYDGVDPNDVFKGENLPAIEVNDCASVTITPPQINIDNLCSEVGLSLTVDTFNFAGGGCKKILAHWEVIDQCIFEENYLYDNGSGYEINPFVPENGYFEMYVEYDLFDTEGPVISTCNTDQIVGCNEEFTGEISASATDNCTEPAFFGWSWKLDVGNDYKGELGTYDFAGEGNKVTPQMLDKDLTAFPAGTHRITWIVSDGCGNISTEDCTFGLDVEDNKAPTPYCYDGLSTAVMQMSGSVTLWASDFDAGSFDDCSDVLVSIIPERDVEGLSDLDAFLKSLKRIDGVYGWEFDCSYIPNGVSAEIDVRMYAFDESTNYDYCVATLRLSDNLGACEDVEGSMANLGGNVSTVYGAMVDEVQVEAMTNNPEYPVSTVTDNDGMYAFYNNPANYDYEITAAKNVNFLENVSTLDLVLIQKHILGLELLDNPYKIIAANVNNDTAVKASDLLVLRKLILGLYEGNRLPNHDSWVFIPKSLTFSDPSNPFPYMEMNYVESLSGDVMSADFVAVKIGDVSYNTPGLGITNAQVRSAGSLDFVIDNQTFNAGDLVKVDFTATNFNDVFGYQFTLEFNNQLAFAGIDKGSLNLEESNFGLVRAEEGIITTSFHNTKGVTSSSDEVLFTINFVAKEAGSLEGLMALSSKITAAESYVNDDLVTQNVSLQTRNGEVLAAADKFELYQNEPNPFRGSTLISFQLPEATNATLSIYDVTGKVIYRTQNDYVKGLNSVRIEGLNANGVLYYQVDTDTYSATKKMIVIE